jgi:hypothetical protein
MVNTHMLVACAAVLVAASTAVSIVREHMSAGTCLLS